jgi:hypothetical protein
MALNEARMTFTYREVEAALAVAHEIPEARMGAFRGRLKHFLRLGLVPSSPGKGNKITYTLENVYMWALCLELEEFGLDPVRIKDLHRLGDLRPAIDMLVSGKGWMNYLIFHPNFLSEWHEDRLWTASIGFVNSLGEIDTATWGRPVTGGRPMSERYRSRVGAISLIWLREAVLNALAAPVAPIEKK